jgi:pimeloyl-ACP methyl ester carboxylesterase
MVLSGGQSTMKGTMRTTKSTFIREVLKTTTKPVRSLIKKMLGLMPILAGIACLTLVAGEAAAQRTASVSGVKAGIVTLTDSKIQYFSRGKGETIVLLPGGTLTVGYLDGLAEALANAGYRVVGINFRGSGKSTGSSKGVTLQTNADDVAGVVKALNLGPVHMVGNDFGNRVARMFAASHPELTRSVILLAAGGKVPPKPAAGRALMIIFNPKSTDADVLAVMPYLVSNPTDSARVWAIFKPSRDPGAASIEQAAGEATPLKVWWAPPGKTKYLILQGTEDQIAPPENGEELQKELGARATLVNVPGAAHLLPLEQPETTASHMITFIRELGSKP